jgi:hypothetical protein
VADMRDMTLAMAKMHREWAKAVSTDSFDHVGLGSSGWRTDDGCFTV